MTPVFLVISAPSGAGKTTISAGLLAANADLRRVITCTTRTPRPVERDGVDYHFLDLPNFERRVAGGEFLEHAEVYGNHYGTLKASVLDQLRAGHHVVLSVDVQGVASIRQAAATDAELATSLVTAFLTPPSLSELERRLRGRAADPESVIARRLATARHEADQWRSFDYLVVSRTREEDFRQMQAILEVETWRTCRREFQFQP